MGLKVLIVDDEPAIPHALGVLLDLHDIAWCSADSPDAAVDRLKAGGIGVVLQDMNFGAKRTSGEQGVELFRRLREVDPHIPILLMTAWASLETAVALVKEGAADYLAKPWDDDKLLISVQNLMEMRSLQMENARLQQGRAEEIREFAAKHRLCGLIHASRQMQELLNTAVHVARSDAPVLLTGPSGSGKEKLAEIVQANSRRAKGPFLRVNLGALPGTLLEAELFGAEAGAFTGATTRRIGRFEAADGGTLFLDEIDSLPIEDQVKLLRVVQSGDYQRLGSTAARKCDVRLIAATNSDLPLAVKQGRFREDLYYRLNVVGLHVPALNLRPDDILPLADHFLANGEGATAETRFTEDARKALLHHRWDGNVRELQNVVQRAALTAATPSIDATDLDLADRGRGRGRGSRRRSTDAGGAARVGSGPGTDTADHPERVRIENALLQASGIVAHAAELLGISRQALYRKMEKFGIVLERRPRI